MSYPSSLQGSRIVDTSDDASPVPSHHEPTSDPPDGNGFLPFQHLLVPLVRFGFTILQPRTTMILQHAVFAAIAAVTERAVADDGLRGGLAVGEGAAFLVAAGGAGAGC